MSDDISRTLRHARQRYAQAVAHRIDAKSLKSERKADRRAAAARRQWVAALRLADLEA